VERSETSRSKTERILLNKMMRSSSVRVGNTKRGCFRGKRVGKGRID
jgi:hypothetical protein